MKQEATAAMTKIIHFRSFEYCVLIVEDLSLVYWCFF